MPHPPSPQSSNTAADHCDGLRQNSLSIDVVVFDMGGVLVKLGSLPDLLGLGGDVSEFWPRWLTSPAVRDFECGRTSPESFAGDLVEELDLRISPDEFLANFGRFPTGLYPGARDLVADVDQVCQTALLSNTNALHWDNQPDNDVISTFCDREFLSFQMGLLKPDRQVFDHVASELATDPNRILLLDDNQMNVDGARQAGWRAEVALGPVEARLRLSELEILEPTL